jgi:hypothetical protein
MIDNSKVVYLEITTFRGVSIGQHYYGRLTGQYRRSDDVSLRKVMTSREAKWLTRFDSHGYTYRKGDRTSRFDLVEDIRKLALKEYKEHFPNCEILIEGDHIVAQPQLVLWCIDPADMEQMNKIYQDGEDLCGWDWDKEDSTLRRLLKEWRPIADKYGLQERFD